VLEKSASLPLTLEVVDTEDNPFVVPEQNQTHQAIEALAQEGSRWHHLTIKLTLPITNAFFASIVGKLSMLASLAFDNKAKTGHVSMSDRRLSLFRTIPTLRTVTLTNPYGISYILVLKALDTVNLVAPPIQMISAMLGRARNLRVLRVDHCHGPLQGAPVVQEQSVVKSESLHTLDIRFIHCSTYPAINHLFSCISLPQLQTLSLTDPDNSYCLHPHHSNWVPSLVGMLNHSHCSIQTLAIIGVRITQDSLISILRNGPTLRNLTLHECLAIDVVIDEKLLQLLTLSTITSGSATLLPNLERIELHADGTLFTDKAFVDMVSSRWRGNPYRQSPVSVGPGGMSTSMSKGICSVSLRVLSRELVVSHYRPLKMLEKKKLFIAISGKSGAFI
jgi:hypothetical protein